MQLSVSTHIDNDGKEPGFNNMTNSVSFVSKTKKHEQFPQPPPPTKEVLQCTTSSKVPLHFLQGLHKGRLHFTPWKEYLDVKQLQSLCQMISSHNCRYENFSTLYICVSDYILIMHLPHLSRSGCTKQNLVYKFRPNPSHWLITWMKIMQ